jgi:hypothetical protein
MSPALAAATSDQLSQLQPSLTDLGAIESARFLGVGAFRSPQNDLIYATCWQFALDELLVAIEKNPNLTQDDFLIATTLVEEMNEKDSRAAVSSNLEISRVVDLSEESVSVSLSRLCGAGYFRAIRPSQKESELGIRTFKYEPQLDASNF